MNRNGAGRWVSVRLASWMLVLGLAAITGCQPKQVGAPPDLVQPTSSSSRVTESSVPSTETPETAPTESSAEQSAEQGAEQGADQGAGQTAEKDGPVREPPVRAVPRQRAVPGQPLPISFDDLVIGMQANVVYREWMMSERAKELDGQVVRIAGYMYGGPDRLKNLKELIILRNTECKFGEGGQADHLIRVNLQPGVTAKYTQNAVEVVGVLKINPWQGPDGNTWSIYDLSGTAFKDLGYKR